MKCVNEEVRDRFSWVIKQSIRSPAWHSEKLADKLVKPISNVSGAFWGHLNHFSINNLWLGILSNYWNKFRRLGPAGPIAPGYASECRAESRRGYRL